METVGVTLPHNLSGYKRGAEASVTETPAALTPPIPLNLKTESLKPKLSKAATILFPSDTEFASGTARWSTYDAPSPGAVVNVASESDLAATVKWATETSTPFLARSGGHGFTSSVSSVGQDGIIINLGALNKVSVSLSTKTAVISAGALTQEVVEVAHAAKAHVMTGVCNSVGVIAPMLGGGFGNLMALYGMAVDNMVSARLVTATGDIVTVSADENPDLWWGLRGAGHNFGIVSELTVKAHEQVNGGVHWGGTIAFPGTGENVEKIVETINAIGLGTGKPMGVTMVWAKVPPEFHPAIMINLWYAGTAEAAKAAFAPFFSLNPVMDMTGPTPYTVINAPSDFASVKNGHLRPCYGSAVSTLSPSVVVQLFHQWVEFVSTSPDLGASVVITECYDYQKAKELGGKDGMATAFPWREEETNILAVTDFTDKALEKVVVEYGRRFRETLGEGKVYVNFACGDEDMGAMYGNKERVARLKALKAKWDPSGVFSAYNPIV